MKILLVNKYHYLKGGSETYYFELGNMLKKNGHEIAYFSMEDEKNIRTNCKEYFVPNIDMNSKNITKSLEVIYSSENKKLMDYALEEFKPDIVHINNFQRQLSASIIKSIKEHNIPVVYTAHDLQAICPASAMLRHGKICDKCLNCTKYNCFFNKCIKDSTLKSLLASIEATYYKRKKIYDKFDIIISPSNFVANMLKKGGIDTKIVTLHNYINIREFSSYKTIDDNYAFYFGRLSIEKGIFNLIEAFSKQEFGRLLIAGDGPEKNNIEKYIKDKNLENRIKLIGFLSRDEVKEYISKSSFVVVPSIWYENCPYSILETLAMGKAVVGSRIGGIPELINDNENGYLYDYDDVKRLSNIIKKLFSDKDKRQKMGQKSRRLAKEKYNIDNYYNKIIKLYEGVVGK